MAKRYFNAADYPNASDRELHIRRRVHREGEFFRHLMVYGVVMAGLWAICLITLPNRPDRALWSYWAIWPTMGWGIGVLCHALTLIPGMLFFSDEWEEKKVQELLKRDANRT